MHKESSSLSDMYHEHLWSVRADVKKCLSFCQQEQKRQCDSHYPLNLCT